MDWSINVQRRLKYNSETNNFEYINNGIGIINSYDRDAAEEIADIKSRVLIKDRKHFFK